MIKCKRCGKCCSANVLSFINDQDIIRWKKESREDILHIIHNWNPIWEGDRLISSETGHEIFTCPFLLIETDKCTCSIYETRPDICKNFLPGSSKICSIYK